jgi:hypothetical protein
MPESCNRGNDGRAPAAHATDNRPFLGQELPFVYNPELHLLEENNRKHMLKPRERRLLPHTGPFLSMENN